MRIRQFNVIPTLLLASLIALFSLNINQATAQGNTAAGSLRLENRNWQGLNALSLPGTEWMNEWLTFSGIKNHLLPPNPFYHQHRFETLRIHNSDPSNALEISALTLSHPTIWKLENNELNVTVPAGGHYDLVVRFIEQEGVIGHRLGTLTLTTNDPANAQKVVNLGAGYMEKAFEPDELPVRDIIAAMGVNLDTGTSPNFSNQWVAYGEEVLSRNWRRKDPTKPIYVRQLSAFHGSNNGTVTLNMMFASGGNVNLTHAPQNNQTLFPIKDGTTDQPAELSLNRAQNFHFRIAGYTSCSSTCNNHGVRIWPLRDTRGHLVPDVFIVAQDYVGAGGGSANYDFNDNMYIAANIEPLTTYPPDLQMIGTPSTTDVSVGQQLSYNFTARNKNMFPADNVEVTFELPTNATYISHTNNTACVKTEAFKIVCDFGDGFVNPHPVSIVLQPTAAGDTRIRSRITTTTPETITNNNAHNINVVTKAQTPPVTVDDAYDGLMNNTLTVTAANGVLKNDTDINHDPLTAVLVAAPDHADDFTLNADGSFTFVPELNWHGTTTFTYQANDGVSNGNTATVTLTFEETNFIPVAADDVYTTAEDTVLTVNAAEGVLANDTDGDASDTLTVTIVNQPTLGNVVLNSDGSFVYTPNTNVHGEDTFSYIANDGIADSNEALVTITITPVNDNPVAQDDLYALLENTTLFIDVEEGVLANDTDADGDTLTATVATDVSNGTLTLNANGSFTYIPATDFVGTDTFTYTASDGNGGTATATVTLEVDEVLDPVDAVNDSYSTEVNTTLTVDVANGVLANDFNPVTANTLTALLETDVTNGTLTLNEDGSFTYIPTTDFVGTDSFTYTADDNHGSSDIATVTITVTEAGVVNTPPVANNDSYTVAQDTTLTVITANGVLANDTDADGDTLTATLVTNVTNGTLTLNSDGSFTYAPSAGYIGADSFTYTASDGKGGSANATATITVTDGSIPPVIDLLTNGSFEVAQADDKNVPQDWKGKNLTKDKIKCNKPEKDKVFASDGNCAFMFKGGAGENSKILQKPDFSPVVVGDTLTLYGDVQGKKVVEGQATLTVKLKYTDDTKGKIVIKPTAGKYDYTTFSDSVTITAPIAKLKAMAIYKGGSGKLIVDNLRLLVNDPNAATPATADLALPASAELLPLPAAQND